MDTQFFEIDEGADYIGFNEAFACVLANARPLGIEDVFLEAGLGRVSAKDLAAPSSYPAADVSLKDGFAVRSSEISQASTLRPVTLRLTGSAFAGPDFAGRLAPGCAVKICSGARIPAGADAVVAEEFCRNISETEVRVEADAGPGRNILKAGSEIEAGSVLIREGDFLLPGNMGLAAAAGISAVPVYRRPGAAIVGIGDEVVAPGRSLLPGQLYASNLVTMGAWLNSFGIRFTASVVKDNSEAIREELQRLLEEADAVLTSGGAWGSERDLVIGALDALGWEKMFHHVRMGPGKGAAFGIWKGKPVFCLPGGPASNQMALLQLALPCLLRMSGDKRHPLPAVSARLAEDIAGRSRKWTEFKDAVLAIDADGNRSVRLCRNRSRLEAIAAANCLICVPEGRESLHRGEIVPVQLLTAETAQAPVSAAASIPGPEDGCPQPASSKL